MTPLAGLMLAVVRRFQVAIPAMPSSHSLDSSRSLRMGSRFGKRVSFGFALILGLVLFCAAPAWATNFPVASTGDLVNALNPSTGAQNGDTITFTSDITLTQDMPAVQNSVTINGGGYTLDGASTYRGFLVANFNNGSTLTAVTVTIENLTIQNTLAQGGNGGSGYSGGGGGPDWAGRCLWPMALA